MTDVGVPGMAVTTQDTTANALGLSPLGFSVDVGPQMGFEMGPEGLAVGPNTPAAAFGPNIGPTSEDTTTPANAAPTIGQLGNLSDLANNAVQNTVDLGNISDEAAVAMGMAPGFGFGMATVGTPTTPGVPGLTGEADAVTAQAVADSVMADMAAQVDANNQAMAEAAQAMADAAQATADDTSPGPGEGEGEGDGGGDGGDD
jgi:hypothetical protein